MHLARCDEGRRIGRQIARQQGGDQHSRLVGDRLDGRPGIAAQHHDELDVLLEDELRGAGPCLVRRVLVVVGDELEPVGVVSDPDAARRVDLLGPDPAAVEAGKPPGRDRPGEGGEESDPDRLVRGGESRRGEAARHGGARDRGAEKRPPADLLVEQLLWHCLLPLICRYPERRSRAHPPRCRPGKLRTLPANIPPPHPTARPVFRRRRRLARWAGFTKRFPIVHEARVGATAFPGSRASSPAWSATGLRPSAGSGSPRAPAAPDRGKPVSPPTTRQSRTDVYNAVKSVGDSCRSPQSRSRPAQNRESGGRSTGPGEQRRAPRSEAGTPAPPTARGGCSRKTRPASRRTAPESVNRGRNTRSQER